MQSPTEKKENRKECKPVSGRVSADRKAAGSPAHMGLLLAFALILSYIELLIPFQPGIPGVKLGLSNLAVVLCLYLLGWRKALLLTVVKAIFSGLLFGNLFMILYSLAGAAGRDDHYSGYYPVWNKRVSSIIRGNVSTPASSDTGGNHAPWLVL